MKPKDYICEGCDAKALNSEWPDGWVQTGASLKRMPERHIASWCRACVENGTIDREAKSCVAINKIWKQRRADAPERPTPSHD